MGGCHSKASASQPACPVGLAEASQDGRRPASDLAILAEMRQHVQKLEQELDKLKTTTQRDHDSLRAQVTGLKRAGEHRGAQGVPGAILAGGEIRSDATSSLTQQVAALAARLTASEAKVLALQEGLDSQRAALEFQRQLRKLEEVGINPGAVHRPAASMVSSSLSFDEMPPIEGLPHQRYPRPAPGHAPGSARPRPAGRSAASAKPTPRAEDNAAPVAPRLLPGAQAGRIHGRGAGRPRAASNTSAAVPQPPTAPVQLPPSRGSGNHSRVVPAMSGSMLDEPSPSLGMRMLELASPSPPGSVLDTSPAVQPTAAAPSACIPAKGGPLGNNGTFGMLFTGQPAGSKAGTPGAATPSRGGGGVSGSGLPPSNALSRPVALAGGVCMDSSAAWDVSVPESPGRGVGVAVRGSSHSRSLAVAPLDAPAPSDPTFNSTVRYSNVMPSDHTMVEQLRRCGSGALRDRSPLQVAF